MKTGRIGVSVGLCLLLPVLLLQGCGDGKGVNEFASTTVGSDEPASISLSASPANITGGDIATTVTATVLGASGSSIADDTVVYFQFTNATAATFATGSSITSQATTTSGVATATVTAGTVDGTLIINAYTENGVQATAALTVTVDHPEMTVTISSDPANIAGGNTSATVTANVAYDTGEAVEDGTVVYFAFTNSADADFATGATITPQGTTSSGAATATITAGSANGELFITATTATGAASAPLQVLVEDITLSVSMSGSTSIVAGGARVKVTATVETSTEVPVEGQTVTFSTNLGTLYTDAAGAVVATTVDTSSSGRSSVYLAIVAGTTGTATVTGRITGPDGEDISGSLNITVQPYQVVISPIDDIKANGIATALVRVNLKDGSGNAVAGEIVRFQTSLGAIATTGVAGVTNPNTSVNGYPTSETDASGDAVALLSAGNVSGTATITIKVLSALDDSNAANIVMTKTTTAALTLVTPTTLVLNATPAGIVAGSGQNIVITGRLTDSGGDPIANQVVNFETSDPDNTSITPSATTSSAAGTEGEVTVNFSSGTVAGVFAITATAQTGGVEQQLQIEVLSSDPFLVKMKDGYPDPTTVRVKGTGGQETSRLIFVVTDQYDNRVSDSLDVYVVFLIDSGPGGGEILSPVRVQTSNGEAAVNLVAGFRTGTVKVRATLEEDNGLYAVSTGIAIVEGPLSTASIGIVAQQYNIAGRVWTGLEDEITVYLADEAGDAVPDDTAVTFLTNETGGMFEHGAAVTGDGSCADTLITTPNPVPVFGFVSATAMADGEESVAVQSIAVDSSDRFYVGTDGAGIFKADIITDGLREWEEKNGQYHFVGPRVFDLVIPDTCPNVVYAATSLGLFKTNNQGATWLAGRSPNNGNRIGFETPAPATSVALASDYLDPAATSTADRTARVLAETDVLVGTLGYGVYYNVSAGMAYQIIDADGSTTADTGLAGSFLTDGTQSEYFDSSEGVYYFVDSDEPGGYDIAADTNDPKDGVPDVYVLDSDGDTPVLANMTPVTSFAFNPQAWKYIDSNGNGTYDHDQNEEIVKVNGWSRSPVLGIGVFVNRLCSFQIAGTDYAFAATDSGMYRSDENLNGGPLGRAWEDVGDDDVQFTAVKITDVICNGDDVFASSWSNGMFYTLDGTAVTTAGLVDWVGITSPTATDELLYDGTGTSANGDALYVFLDTDNIMFKDFDSNGVYNEGDPVFVDANSDGLYTAGETQLDVPAGSTLVAGDAGISAVNADEWIRYADTDGDYSYDDGVDDVYFDRDSDLYVDVNAETYSRITCLAYSATSDRLYCGTQTGGVFMSTAGAAGNYSTWQALDTRLTGVNIARLKWATIGAEERLYIGGACKALFVEYNITTPGYTDVSRGESNTKIDTSIMDRTPVLFSGHISPQVVYDPNVTNIAAAPGAGETNPFVFALVLEDDFGNPAVAGTEITVSVVNHEMIKKINNDGNVEVNDTTTSVSVGGYGDWTIGDAMSSGRGFTVFTYTIGAGQVTDGDYTGVDSTSGAPVAVNALEYTVVYITVNFKSWSNFGDSGGGEYTYSFMVDIK